MTRNGIGFGARGRAPAAALLAAAALVSAPQAAGAPPGPPPAEQATLSVASAVRMALERYPSVAALRARLEEARAAVGESRAGWWPSLSLSGSATRYEEPALAAPIHSFGPGAFPDLERTLFQSGAHLAFTLFDGGARGARVRAARAQAGAAGSALRAAEQALASQVVAAYLDAVGAREMLRAHDHRLEALDTELRRARDFLESGRAARVDLLRVEAAAASAEAERVRLAAALENAERELARLTGDDSGRTSAAHLASVALADTAAPARESAIDAARGASPRIEQARLRVLAAEANRSAAQGARWPELRLGAHLIDYASPRGTEATEWNAGVQASLPLFTGGALGRRIEGAAAAHRQTEHALRLEEFELARAVDAALASSMAARARTAALALAVARYEEVTRVEAMLLDAGSGTQAEYLRAEADLLAARADLVEARHAQILARVELARLAGALSADWIATNLEARP